MTSWTPVTRVVGACLQHARESRMMLPEEPAELLGVTPQALLAMEEGRFEISTDVLADLTGLYRCEADEPGLRRLLAQRPEWNGMTRDREPGHARRLAACTQGAARVRWLSYEYLPAPLQTPHYAQAVAEPDAHLPGGPTPPAASVVYVLDSRVLHHGSGTARPPNSTTCFTSPTKAPISVYCPRPWLARNRPGTSSTSPCPPGVSWPAPPPRASSTAEPCASLPPSTRPWAAPTGAHPAKPCTGQPPPTTPARGLRPRIVPLRPIPPAPPTTDHSEHPVRRSTPHPRTAPPTRYRTPPWPPATGTPRSHPQRPGGGHPAPAGPHSGPP